MAETLTTYGPAEDLTSDLAIGTFMAEAFETGDSGYIAHALGVVARAKGMRRLRVRRVCRASNSIVRSVRWAIRL